MTRGRRADRPDARRSRGAAIAQSRDLVAGFSRTNGDEAPLLEAGLALGAKQVGDEGFGAERVRRLADERDRVGGQRIELIRHLERAETVGEVRCQVTAVDHRGVRFTEPDLGHDLPLIRYSLNDEDFARFRRGIDLLVRMFFAAGAKEVTVPGLVGATTLRSVAELEAFWRRRPSRRDFFMSAYHPLGTARIGADPARGVCDPDHAVRGHPGLYVMDGASVPTALGANPQVTIMAMALRAASRLADRLVA